MITDKKFLGIPIYINEPFTFEKRKNPLTWKELFFRDWTTIINTSMMAMVVFIMIILTLHDVLGQTMIDPGFCYSQDNVSVCANNCTQPNTTVFNISIAPGVIQTYSDAFCSGSLSCSSCLNVNTTLDKCIIENGRIRRGSTFTYTSANCDVTVSTDECEERESCQLQGTTNYEIPFKIAYSELSKRIQINFNDKEYITQIDSSIDASGMFNYTCPINIVNTSNGGQLTLDQCKAVVPMYCDAAFNIMVQKFEGCEESKREYETKLENCRVEKQNMVQNSVCVSNEQYAELQARKITLENETVDCNQEAGAVKYENLSLQETQTFLIIIIIILSGLCIFIGVKYKKATSTGIPSEEY